MRPRRGSLSASLLRRPGLRSGSGLRSCADLRSCAGLRPCMQTVLHAMQTSSYKTLLPPMSHFLRNENPLYENVFALQLRLRTGLRF